jgi:methylated-DNA-[protein]-cysteine S-methyltransferase
MRKHKPYRESPDNGKGITRYRDMKTPIGAVRVAWCDKGVVAIETGRQLETPAPRAWTHDPSLECLATEQLREYFDGRRRAFDLPLALEGTPFQRTVWKALTTVGYGETISYTELALRAGRPGAARAAGAANGQNPLSIVLPCHRVIGADGHLTGYAGGLGVKEWLLTHEAEPQGAETSERV